MSDSSQVSLSLPSTGEQSFDLAAHRGHPVVIYFYPKDATPGCTTESQNFRDLHPEFQALGCTVVGISRDSIASHEKFKTAQALPFELLSDKDEIACQQFDVIKNKTMYGKPVRGIERSTCVIDANGKLAREWRGVKVDGHAAEVLEYVKSLHK
jgi:peroxiredoxin Q/BCP